MNIINRYFLGNLKLEDIVVGKRFFIIEDHKDNKICKIGQLIEITGVDEACKEDCICFPGVKKAFRFCIVNKSTNSIRNDNGFDGYSCWYKFRRVD